MMFESIAVGDKVIMLVSCGSLWEKYDIATIVSVVDTRHEPAFLLRLDQTSNEYVVPQSVFSKCHYNFVQRIDFDSIM